MIQRIHANEFPAAPLQARPRCWSITLLAGVTSLAGVSGPAAAGGASAGRGRHGSGSPRNPRPKLPPHRRARSMRRPLSDIPSRVPYTERGVPVSAKVLRYAQRLVEQYDTNHNGQLEKDEWQKMRGNPAIVDRDHDGLITVEDLARYITIYGRYRHIQLIAPALTTNPPQPSVEGCRRRPPRIPAAISAGGAKPWGRLPAAETPPARGRYCPPARADARRRRARPRAGSPTTTTGSNR